MKTATNDVSQLFDLLHQNVQSFLQSDKYRQYLTTMSRFHRYSARNSLLILLQNPDASYVAGFQHWKNAFQRFVRKGEHGIQIIGYRPQKISVKENVHDMHGNIIYGADGQPQTRVATRIIPRYYPCYVFDVSQTDGKPLPELAPELTGDVHRFEQYFEAIKACSPFPVSIENFAGTAKGVCDLATQSIRIKPNMGQTQTLKTLIHETAHALLHSSPEARDLDRPTKEVEAESTAFIICAHYEIDTSDYSFPYVATWGEGKDIDVLQASFERIHDISAALIEQIDEHIQELQHGSPDHENSLPQEPMSMADQLSKAKQQADNQQSRPLHTDILHNEER